MIEQSIRLVNMIYLYKLSFKLYEKLFIIITKFLHSMNLSVKKFNNPLNHLIKGINVDFI